MQTYANLNGESGVRAFEIAADSIAVEFADGGIYLYTNHATGTANVERMKHLALAGQGLNTFINQVVRTAYASKLR